MWQIKLPPPQGWIATTEMFSSEELDRIAALTGDPIQAKVTTDRGAELDPKKRASVISWIKPSDDTAWLFHLIEDAIYQFNKHFQMKLTHIQDLQLTEYDTVYEGHFGAHIDEAWGVDRPEGRRKLSMSVQLSEPEEYDGGDLLLYPLVLRPITIPKQRGMTAVFRSHIIHEVTPVTRGIRKSLVIWVCGPPGEL